jgi:hypothetical protein
MITVAIQYIPQVSFADLDKLSEAQIADIKRKGTVVIKDVVDDEQARAWKTSLEEFVKANPQSDGLLMLTSSAFVSIINSTRVPGG